MADLIFHVKNRSITCERGLVTSNSVESVTAQFLFEDGWDAWAKEAVFANRNVQRKKILSADVQGQFFCTVPYEVLAEAGTLRIGVCGTASYVGTDGELYEKKLPTVWCEIPLQEGVPHQAQAGEELTLTQYGRVLELLGTKQAKLTFDNVPAENSSNPVKSGGIYAALKGKQDVLTFDGAPVKDSENPVTSGGIYAALEDKQDALTFDNVPVKDSENPVTSGGIYAALEDKQDALTFDSAPEENSENPVTSGGVYRAVGERMQWCGAWEENTTYHSNDLVSESGALYLSLCQGNRSNMPAESPEKWKLITCTVSVSKNERLDGAITSIVRISGDGTPGSTDVYQYTCVDTTTGTFTVYNGKNGETPVTDDVVAAGSTNAVSGGAVYMALAGKQDVLTFDHAPEENSENPVTSGGVSAALAGKQDVLTFDHAPEENSENPVTSGGVYAELAGKEDKNVYTLLEKVTTVKANAVQVISKTFTEPLRALRIVFVQGATDDVNYSMKLTATDENLRNLILPDLTGLHGTVETHGYMELKPVYGYWEGEEAMTTSWGSGYSAIKYTAPYLIQKYPASKLMMMRLQVNGDGRMFTDGEIQIWGVKA